MREKTVEVSSENRDLFGRVLGDFSAWSKNKDTGKISFLVSSDIFQAKSVI